MKRKEDGFEFRREVERREVENKAGAYAPSPNVASGWNDSTPLSAIPSGIYYALMIPVLDKLRTYVAGRAYDVETALEFFQEAQAGIYMEGTMGTMDKWMAIGQRHVERIRKSKQRHEKDMTVGLVREDAKPKDTRGYNADGLKETDEDA